MQNHAGIHVTRRNFIRGLGLMSASAALAACASQPASSTSGSAQAGSSGATPLLAIIHTNDTHGHDVEVKATEKAAGNFSMAAVPMVKAEWEKKGYEVIVVDAGDATQGMPLVDQSKGEAGITFMNACGYQFMTVGNHEFDRGDDEIKKFEEMASFPLVSANVKVKATGELRFAPNKVFELSDGTKVGFFGLTTPSTVTTSRPEYTQAFEFLGGKDLYACAQAQVDELKSQGCAIVVCVAHLGNEEVNKSNTSKDVLSQVKGIDLLIDGHDHKEVSEEVGGVLLVETGCYLNNIGVVAIDDGAPVDNRLAYGSFEGTDAAAQAVIDDVDKQVQSELGVVLGHTNFTLDGEKANLRAHETNLGDFCCDAFLWSCEQASGIKPDAALYNGGGLRSTIAEGDISLANIKAVVAFSNQLMLAKVTGAQLLEALESAYQVAGADTMGGFAQVAGIEVKIDASVPYEKGDQYPNSTFYAPAKPGSRVTISTVGGRAWSADETYTVATSDFICTGGDCYYVFKQAADAAQPQTCDFDYEAVSSYLIDKCDHEVPAEYEDALGQGRITIVGA
ncbi:MAG: 5'-nucleotidase C-terminal domain-containing protein [Coriobacteriales bacterium]|nr:5'-nucleotidase C-terminal domain-containing protein [Coriobacteriales bacterium]